MDNQKYEWAVNELARKKVDSLFPNGKPEHARIIFNKFFQMAKQKVRIYSGSLLSESNNTALFSWEPLIESAKNFLDKPNTSIEILLEGNLDKDGANKFYSELKNYTSRSDAIKFKTLNRLKGKEDEPHFAVMDQEGFRIEVNHGATKALASFNKPDIANRLVEIFEREFKTAKDFNESESFAHQS